jgi:1,2-phenylacetyl-CoA epoxidase PaaB subunit
MSGPRKLESAAGDVYDVFAKIKPEDAFRHIGNVVAPDATLARVYAFTMYQEWAWSEMFVVPRRAMVPIIEAA